VLHFIASFHEFHAWHILIRIDAETDVIYELIAEPVQKPFAGEPQPGEVVNQAPGETTNPIDLQGKPRCITLNFSIQ
jgi:hypothetical protein